MEGEAAMKMEVDKVSLQLDGDEEDMMELGKKERMGK